MENTLLLAFKGESAQVLALGAYSEIKAKFRALRDASNPNGFDKIAIWKKVYGEVVKYDYLKAARKAEIAKITEADLPPPESPVEDEPTAEPIEADETETLITLAKGDGRRADVKEARDKLDEMGIAY